MSLAGVISTVRAPAAPVAEGQLDGSLVLLVLMWMAVSAVSCTYGIGVWAYAAALKEDDAVLLGEPDGTVARWAIAIWWPLFGFFRSVEWVAKKWRQKSWP